MKYAFLFVAAVFAACTSTELVNCLDTPSDSTCVETCNDATPPDWCACVTSPSADSCRTVCDEARYSGTMICRQFQMDGGTDAMDAGDTSDVEVDAGPCGGGCDSGLHCNEATDEGLFPNLQQILFWRTKMLSI